MAAINTSLGWTFQGPTKTRSSVSEQSDTLICVLRTAVEIEDDTSLALRRFWDLEHLGITDNLTPDQDDQALMERFEGSIEFQDGRYRVNLPFKQQPRVDLPSNRGVALERMKRMSTRLARGPEMLARYDEAIRTYLEEGHAEKVKSASDEADTGQVYYMPHRPVIRESSATTKLRVVFDASSHASGAPSLNDCLEKGPKMVPDLVRLLLRFRLHRIAITADVRKAFLQIGIKEEDRDFLRFLWFSTPPTPGHEMPPVEEWRMTAVPFGTAASPFLLAATLSHHLRLMKEEFPETATVLESSMYVDDMITGAATLEEALRICSESTDIFKRAGMELGKWASSSKALNDVFEEHTAKNVTRALGTSAETKVLGVVWKREDDVFKFDTSAIVEFLTSRKNTKRFLLQATARIFDPLAFLSPFVIRVKIMFQKLWVLGIDWDCELPDDLSSEWDTWCQDIPKLSLLHTQRCLIPISEQTRYTVQLHVFTDASPHAYGAAVYLRVRTETGQVHVNLMLAKARVAPIKRLTLPRLELMGALIGARLLSYAARILHAPAAEYHMWTDSTIALSWIRSSANGWKPFVSNRVTEIQGITDPARWRHCPGHCNPADLVTRGITAEICVSSSLWWRGPEWLQREEVCWPEPYVHTAPDDRAPNVVDEERAGASSPPPYLILGVADTEGRLLQLERFSKLSRVLRVTAWVMRFVAKCRRTEDTPTGPLTTEEIRAAETYWIRRTQDEQYQPEIHALSKQRSVSPESELFQINPFLDDRGMLRVTGRLQQGQLEPAVRHPIILPPRHGFTELVVQSAHCRILHGGVLETMTELREMGLPELIYSDNALTFRRAAKDIRGLWEHINSAAVRDFCSTHNIRWRFIVERAAWWGGFWERMVRTVKGCLRKTLGKARLGYEALETVLHEVEAACQLATTDDPNV
ncbi:uncharacterized protein LOC135389381 [Ornithodoros turicata]|uniref:uncharacterized protein LOC135389381 n=1 Tax=Ornithodoros turicata TaxID=34597 RepID=UPI00313A2AB7